MPSITPPESAETCGESCISVELDKLWAGLPITDRFKPALTEKLADPSAITATRCCPGESRGAPIAAKLCSAGFGVCDQSISLVLEMS